MDNFLYLILICVLGYFLYRFLSKFKFPKIGAISVFTGGVKTGKSACSLACAVRNYKRVQRQWRFRCFLIKFINQFRRKVKFEFPERPLFYSSIPVRHIPYIPLTREYLLRQRRFAFKSVVFIDEMSLVADSQLVKDKKINTELLLFFKLFGHETHGGLCIVNSHCLTDLHYSLKRTTSQYFYIHHLSKYIPFITICNMREERYSEDGTSVNAYNEDTEDTLKPVLMRSRIFKLYDSFCFSFLTDNLQTDTYEDTKLLGKGDSLKAEKIVSFRPEFYELTEEKIEDNIVQCEVDINDLIYGEIEKCVKD